MSTETSAFEEGRKAYKHRDNQNPYFTHSRKWWAWEDGWRRAELENSR